MIWPDASFKKLGLLEFQNKGVTCDLINSIVQGLAWNRVQLKFDPKISEMHMKLICKFKKKILMVEIITYVQQLESCWKPLELCTACDTLVILVDKQINKLTKKNPCKDSRMLDVNSMYFKMRRSLKSSKLF